MRRRFIWIGVLFVVIFIILVVFLLPSKNNGLDVDYFGAMEITSVFGNNEEVPEKYTCDADNVNPEIKISGVPSNAASLVIIVDDPDAPLGTWTHWILYNIDVGTKSIPENSVVGEQGVNDFKEQRYGGPCPPSGVHRYVFKVFALDDKLVFSESPDRKEMEKALEGHILDKAELVGTYSKKKMR